MDESFPVFRRLPFCVEIRKATGDHPPRQGGSATPRSHNSGPFLAWAKRIGIDYPQEFEDKIAARGDYIGDWKTLYDELKGRYDDLNRRRDELFAEYADLLGSAEKQNEFIRKLIQERDALQRQLSALEPRVPAQTDEAPLKPKERDSALKLIIGMAISGYRYDPKANRNEATRDIANDLDNLGIALDPDTVRKWLREAADLLPPNNC